MRERMAVTGASGFLGTHLCRDLSELFEIIPVEHAHFDKASIGEMGIDLPDHIEFLSQLSRKRPFQVLVHTAAVANADICENNPARAYGINVIGTKRISEFCRATGILMIYISTDLVYGSGSGRHDESQASPFLVYGKTKYQGESHVLSAGGIVLRCALIYGPDCGSRKSFLGRMHENILMGKPLNLFVDQYRTPIWSADISNAIALILQKKIRHNLFNLGGPERITRYDFALKAAEVLEWPKHLLNPIRMEDLVHLANRPKDCSLNSDKAIHSLGWRQTSIEDGLIQYKNSITGLHGAAIA